nr:retrovirus-related Pol polyprotein from transposon TNT 1-94 [Tanacetum cinerariifolium]
MNYLEEQTDGEAIINSIKNGDQPLHRVTQVSIAGTSSTEQPPLKDKSMWSDQEKRIQKIDRLARSLLIQGRLNDIYSLTDSNKTAKDLWDALARHMLDPEYEVINDLKKCGYSKDNCELNFKFLNNLQPEWKQYATMMRQNKNLTDIDINALYNILKQNQGDVNDAMGSKKKTVVVTSDPLALIAEKTNVNSEGSEADDFSELKKITALLAKDFNRRNFYSKPTNNNLRTSSTSQSANKKQEFIKTDNKKVEKKNDEKKRDMSRKRVEKENQQSKDFKNQNKDLQDKYNALKNQLNTFEEKNNEFTEQIKVLNEKNVDLLTQTKVLTDQLQVKHVMIDTHIECQEKYAKLEAKRYEYMIRYSAYFDNDKQHRKHIADQEVLYGKMSIQLVELDKHVRDLKNMVLEKDYKISELEECVRNKDLEIENVWNINFEDDYFQEIINPDFEKIDSPFQQTSSLKPYVPNVILEKIIIDLEDEDVNLLEREKANLKTIESLKSKECDKVENSNVIAPEMFKLSVSQCVSPISMLKTSCESNHVEIKLKRKRHLDTFSSVRRPKHSGVIWKKKGSSNTSNVDLSAVSHLKLNKNVKRYSRKDLLACNNSHLGETSSASVCNVAMNVSCNSKMCDLLDDNNFFIFDDESVKISPVSKMPFRKKHCDSMNIIDSGCSKHVTGNRALLKNFVKKFLGTVRFGNNDFVVIAGHGDVVIGSLSINKVYYVEGLGHNLFSVGQFCDKGLEVTFRKSTCFVRNEDGVDLLTGDHSSNLYTIALNERVRNNNGTEFKNKTLAKFFDEVGITQQFFAARTPQQNGVVERRNRTLVEAARTMLTFANLPSFLWAEAIATACFTQNGSIIHKRFDKTPYELINKRKPNIKFFRVFGCRCYLLNDYEDVGKLKANGDIGVFVGYSTEYAAFRIYNK